jgi:hypothetical protein
MNLIQTTGTTNGEGTLTLTLPLGRPNTRFEVAVVAQPQTEGGPAAPDWRSAADAIREQLRATGREFSDSTELIREDRDR